ncbi:MAG: hypothetical protein JOZ69_01430 [Myxococcales bacterium]|nr:hypothetical protein [Myxococcales bacterium]
MTDKLEPPKGPLPGVRRDAADVTVSVGPKAREVASLLGELRTKARELPEDVREEVLETIDKLHAQANASSPNHGHVKMHTRALEAFVDLAPLANRVAELLSNFGV